MSLQFLVQGIQCSSWVEDCKPSIPNPLASETSIQALETGKPLPEALPV